MPKLRIDIECPVAHLMLYYNMLVKTGLGKRTII